MKLKAVFFLVVFMLNTLVGFGCSILMGNEGHEHSHQEHQHLASSHHHHTDHSPDGAYSNLKITSTANSCCKTLVNDFLIQGKLIPDYAKLNLKAPALVPFGFNYTFIQEEKIINADQQNTDQHQYHPPHPDIRISIQSFQI